jgi:hypothetical protein
MWRCLPRFLVNNDWTKARAETAEEKAEAEKTTSSSALLTMGVGTDGDFSLY